MSEVAAGLALISTSFASYLRMSKAQFLECSGTADELFQTGGAYVGEEFEIPTLDGGEAAAGGGTETFVVGPEGGCTSTGSNDRLTTQFLPTANRIAERVLASLAELGVVVLGDSYLTCSVTPADEVTTTPHFDDDLLVPDDGVGVVAIAANIAGTRIATSPIAVERIQSSLPLGLKEQAMDDFNEGLITTQQAAANRVVVFPQFGQLHAGPAIPPSPPGSTRTMFILRTTTKPSRNY